MSLVTRCPACSTLFKVVPDQIRIAAGWVRCGQCGEVFDASAQLLPHGAVPAVPPAPAAPDPSQTDATSARAPADEPPPHGLAHADASGAADADTDAPVDAIADPLTASVDAPAPPGPTLQTELAEIVARREPGTPSPTPTGTPSDSTTAQQALSSPRIIVPSYLRASVEPARAASANPEPEIWPPAASSPAPLEPAADDPLRITSTPVEVPTQAVESSPGAAQPSFVASARRRAFWAARPVRAMLWLGLLLLLTGLLLQWTLTQRDWLAARVPSLTPTLNALCAPLDCRVQPYRQLDAIVIDSSAFNRVAGNQFRFSVSLRNTAAWPVASPALELTLTDRDNQPLVRRVLTAAQCGAPAALPALGEHSTAQTLTVTDPADPTAVVGYRLTAFYP